MDDLGLLLLRNVLGWFFVLARFRYFWDPSRTPSFLNPERHKHLTWKVGCDCHYGGWHPILAGAVASGEVLGGLGVAFGFLTQWAALGLLAILLPATCCTAKKKVLEQNPVDRIDMISSYLWRVEGVYIAIALTILALGPGAWSIDALWRAWL